MGAWRQLAVWALVISAPGPVLAQAADPATSSAPQTAQAARDVAAFQVDFLLIDQDRLYTESAFGRRVVAELEAESLALATENRRIENALIAEEQRITDQRATLSADEFRALADEFDARVTGIRAAQDRKARSLTSRDDEERRRFLNAALPALGAVMQRYGALALLDRRSVFLSSDQIDVTDEAIAAVDAAVGDGAEPALETAPTPEPGDGTGSP